MRNLMSLLFATTLAAGCSGVGFGGDNGSLSSGGAGAPSGGAAGCTLTQGYWKNHPSAWPVTSLTIGGITYSETQLLEVFKTAPSGDASLVLAHQLIAAMLNVAAGAAAPAAITSAIAQAQAWMTANRPPSGRLGYGIPSSSAAGQQATALSDTLDNFNMGGAGVAHCGDGPPKMPPGGGSDGGTSSPPCDDGGSGGGDSSGGTDPCLDVVCQSGFACFKGICQPPIL